MMKVGSVHVKEDLWYILIKGLLRSYTVFLQGGASGRKRVASLKYDKVFR